MERKWIIGISLIILAVAVSTTILLLSGITPAAEQGNSSNPLYQGNDIAGSHSYQIDLKTVMPSNQETILIYKTRHQDVNKESTLALAKKFNVSGTLRGDCVVQSDDLVYGIEILKISGTVRYSNAKRPNDAMDAPGMLPTDEEAVKIATQFLKEKDLLPKGAEPGTAKHEYTVFTDKTGNVIPRNGEVIVGFSRKLNNLEVKGSGVSVKIGGNGEIIGYYANWRDYTPYKEYSIISPETAFVDLKQKGIATGITQPNSVSIDNVYLAYSSKAAAFEEEYLEPVWVFKGQVINKDFKANPVTEYIPALTDDAAKSLSSS